MTLENIAERKERLRRELHKLRNEIGPVALKRWVVVNVVLKHNKLTDDESLIMEENGFESAQRVGLMADEINNSDRAIMDDQSLGVAGGKVNAMGTVDTKLGVLYKECTNYVVEWCLNKMRVGGVVDINEMEMIAAKFGVFRKECEVLLDECAKSAADLCIKKMRVGALVDKLDKRTILVNEIAEARRLEKELQERFRDSETNFRVNEVARKQESQAYAIVQENDVGGEVMDDKQTEISGEKVKKSEWTLLDEKVQDNVKVKASAFARESFRVLIGMLKGVQTGENVGPGVDEAMALADEWAVARIDNCIKKVCYGFLVERRFIFEVLVREIAEARRMEKEVHDRFVIYQRTHDHAQGSATAIVKEKKSVEGTMVGGDQIKHLIERFGFVWENVGLFAVGIVAVAVAGLAKAKKW